MDKVVVVTYVEGGIHELLGVYLDYDHAVAEVNTSFRQMRGEWEVISEKGLRSSVYVFGDAEIWVEEFPVRDKPREE